MMSFKLFGEYMHSESTSELHGDLSKQFRRLGKARLQEEDKSSRNTSFVASSH